MFERNVETNIEINTSARVVWEVLTDLDSFPEWNPMIRRAEGKAEKSERLTLHYNPPGEKLRVFRPKLLVVDPEKEFRWLGSPGIPKLFESEHYFLLEETGPNRTLLTHNMIFYGLFVPAVWPLLESKVKGPFELMNEAHKKRAELLSQKNTR